MKTKRTWIVMTEVELEVEAADAEAAKKKAERELGRPTLLSPDVSTARGRAWAIDAHQPRPLASRK